MVYTYFWLYWQIDLIFIFVCGKQDILTKEKLKTQSIFIQEFIECTSTYINKLRFIWIGIGTWRLSRTRAISSFYLDTKTKRKDRDLFVKLETCFESNSPGMLFWANWSRNAQGYLGVYFISANNLLTKPWFGLNNCHNI